MKASSATNGDYMFLDSGNAAYNKANYTKAINFYQHFLSGGVESEQAYYNLGNCYFRINEIGKAILYYEKAEKLTPGDADVQFNLQLANQKIADKVSSEPPVFIYSDWKNFENKFTEKQWAIIGICLLCLGLLLFGVYLSAPRVLVKQLSFWPGCVIIILSLFTLYVAHQQYQLLNSHDTAIVTVPTVTATGAPDEKATQLFVVHEGTKVWIVKTEGEWTEIKLANGNQGWLISSDISEI
jgi:tetratricopeptide (TPR) repeat protein